MGRQLTICSSRLRILLRLGQTISPGGRRQGRLEGNAGCLQHGRHLLQRTCHKSILATESLGSAIGAGVELQQHIGSAAQDAPCGAGRAQHIDDCVHVCRLCIEDGHRIQLAATMSNWRQLQLLEQQLHTAVGSSDELVGALDVRRVVRREAWRVEVALAQVAILRAGAGKEVKVTEAVRHQASLGAEVLCKRRHHKAEGNMYRGFPRSSGLMTHLA